HSPCRLPSGALSAAIPRCPSCQPPRLRRRAARNRHRFDLPHRVSADERTCSHFGQRRHGRNARGLYDIPTCASCLPFASTAPLGIPATSSSPPRSASLSPGGGQFRCYHAVLGSRVWHADQAKDEGPI